MKNKEAHADVAVIADRTAYNVYDILANYQTVSVTSLRTVGIHNPI